MYRILGNALLFLVLCLAACSDTSVSGSAGERGDMGVVATVEELPPCTAKNDGEPFFVKSEKLIRVCSNSKWYALKNGESGENGGTDENGCVVSKETADSLWVTCGSYSFSVPTSGANKGGSVVLDSEKIATSLEGVRGFTQKGPFLMGSEVNVIELKDGRTLDQTGDNFEAKIQSDDGQFKLNARMMMSQYLELHAKGYYRNEVSGKNSNAQLTLYALTDVMMRSGGVVNINLLTHLEYHRVVYLVKNKKMKVAAAKDTAEREIFNLLHIDSKDFFSSEDLNIVGSSEGDAALLAFSVMFQGDRDVSQLSELLTNVSTDMEKDGKWDNAKMRDSIADWAENAEADGRLATIRANVEGWGLSAMVPNFEKYIRSFWTKEYGLPTCDKANVDTLVAAGAKRLAGSKNRYICIDSAKVGYIWRRATDLEKDTYGWKPGTDGQIKNGDINTTAKYVYDSVLVQWREMTELEELYGFCNEALEADSERNTVLRTDWQIHKSLDGKTYMACENRQWVGYHAHDADTRLWGEASDGTLRRGNYAMYVYDDDFGYWRIAWYYEQRVKKGCTSKNYGDVALYGSPLGDTTYYSCDRNYYPESLPDQDLVETYDKSRYFDHTEFWWVEMNKVVAENTFGIPCTYENNGRMIPGKVRPNSKFVCENDHWREATSEEEMYDEPCLLEYSYGDPYLLETSSDTATCDDGKWRPAIIFDFDTSRVPQKYFNNTVTYGNLHDDRDGRNYNTIQIDLRNSSSYSVSAVGEAMGEPMEWMAQNLNFAGNENYPNLSHADQQNSCASHNHVCHNADTLNCIKGGRFYSWSAAMNIDDKWQNGNAYKAGIIQEQHQGVCPDGWHIPSMDDWDLLFDYVGGASINEFIATQRLFETAPNSTGFSALNTGGIYNLSEECAQFEKSDVQFSWWTTSEKSNTESNSFDIRYSQDSDNLMFSNKEYNKTKGLPVRCVKDYTLSNN